MNKEGNVGADESGGSAKGTSVFKDGGIPLKKATEDKRVRYQTEEGMKGDHPVIHGIISIYVFLR